MMGSKKSDVEPIQGKFGLGKKVFNSETPQFKATISKPFYIGVFVITQAQYEVIIGKNPTRNEGADYPVYDVTWFDAVEFCNKLSESTGEKYRLPTEAEWEYACRAGTQTLYFWGDSEDEMGKYAWYGKNAWSEVWTTPHADNEGIQPVGQKEANAWGLYDMIGNVYEWCSDKYGEYPIEAATDPKGPKSGDFHICRGGEWNSEPWDARSAYRNYADPKSCQGTLGIRVVKEISSKQSDP
jgi:formylglycine-generating enzyme required for sulfatase activity